MIELGHLDRYPNRPPRLICPKHWSEIVAGNRMWAIIWIGITIGEDRRFRHALGLKEGERPSRGQLERAFTELPACCRLGTRINHLLVKAAA